MRAAIIVGVLIGVFWHHRAGLDPVESETKAWCQERIPDEFASNSFFLDKPGSTNKRLAIGDGRDT
jgi:hypothetical protein